MARATTIRLLVMTIAVVSAIPVLLFVGLLCYPAVAQTVHARRFDAAVWQTPQRPPYEPWPPRLRMVDDLTEHHHLPGLTRSEVTNLLGQPDDIKRFQELTRRSDAASWDIGYELSPERGLIIRIDNDWLLLDLDASGRVRRFLVTHD
jgi:hypothetical protein